MVLLNAEAMPHNCQIPGTIQWFCHPQTWHRLAGAITVTAGEHWHVPMAAIGAGKTVGGTVLTVHGWLSPTLRAIWRHTLQQGASGLGQGSPTQLLPLSAYGRMLALPSIMRCGSHFSRITICIAAVIGDTARVGHGLEVQGDTWLYPRVWLVQSSDAMWLIWRRSCARFVILDLAAVDSTRGILGLPRRCVQLGDSAHVLIWATHCCMVAALVWLVAAV